MSKDHIDLMKENELLLDRIEEMQQRIRENNDKIYSTVQTYSTHQGDTQDQKNLAS